MVQIIVGLIVALGLAIGAIFGLKNKNSLLELFNKNKDVLDKVKDLSSQEQQNNNQLTEEQQKRANLQLNIDNRDSSAGTTQMTQQELLDFFNKMDKK